MAQYALDIGQAEFQRAVIELSHRVPVIVDFWAPWCEPCKVLKPLLETLATEYGGRFVLAKINADDNPELSQQLAVRSIPTVLAYLNGEVVKQFSGALPEGELRKFIDALLPSPAEPLRAEALQLAATGDFASALTKIEAALAIDPDHEDMRLDSVELLLALQRQSEASALLDLTYHDANERAKALRIKLAFMAAHNGSDDEQLRRDLAQTPERHDLRLALARSDVAAGRYRQAFDGLLEIVRRERSFDDDAARKTMLQIFDMLAGQADEMALVREYRRLLAAALN